MTLTELEKLEALYAAATPEEWINSLHNAFPEMAKALREALAEVARLQEQVEWLLEGRRQEEQRLALEVDE